MTNKFICLIIFAFILAKCSTDADPMTSVVPDRAKLSCVLNPADKWHVPAGCPVPKCTTFNTIDAWNIGERRSEFGWALVVQVPDTIPSIGWTVAIRVPLQSRGTFESWNGAFYNVYEKDDELVFVMHAKWFYTDTADRSSVVIVGSNLEKSDKPKILLYDGRKSGAECFGNAKIRSGTSAKGKLGSRSEKQPEVYNPTVKEFNKIRIKNGRIIQTRDD